MRVIQIDPQRTGVSVRPDDGDPASERRPSPRRGPHGATEIIAGDTGGSITLKLRP